MGAQKYSCAGKKKQNSCAGASRQLYSARPARLGLCSAG